MNCLRRKIEPIYTHTPVALLTASAVLRRRRAFVNAYYCLLRDTSVHDLPSKNDID